MSSRVVLLVDDKPNFLALFRRVVGSDFELRTAADATEALARSLAREHIDVVLSDVKMPGIDGLELLRRIRRLYRNPLAKRVLMLA